MGFSPFGGGFDVMFTIVPIMIGIVFILVFGIIIYRVIKGGMEWSKNNNSPVLTVAVRIVSKRMAVTRRQFHNDNDMPMSNSSYTTYFATFEVESGDRMELKVPDKEYGMLAEGDIGKLTFQGTRYKGFEREKVHQTM